jgi:tRNA threonylcarbamoyl adenosine modification protein YeaZ
MLLLALDALGPVAAAGVWRDGAALSLSSDASGRADGLAALAERALAQAGVGAGSLDAIAVATGPGGFTGARVAVALARGLSLSCGAPAVGVSLFEAAAHGRAGRCAVSLQGGGGALWSQTIAEGAAEGPPQPAPPGAVAHDFGPGGALAAVAAAGAARLAAHRAAGVTDRPAPLYLRPPDAAPPAEGPAPLLP